MPKTLLDRLKNISRNFVALAMSSACGCGAVSFFQQDYPKRFDKPPLEYIVNKDIHARDVPARPSQTNRYALIVKGKDNGIYVDGDVKNMAKLLLLKNYDVYYTNSAFPSTITNFCKSLSHLSNKDTRFFLFLTGHGREDGFSLKVNPGMPRSILSPALLFSSLQEINGKKAVVVQSCHAGIFYEHLSLAYCRDRDYFSGVLFASCPEDKISVCDPLLGMSAFTYGFCNFFAPDLEEVNLAGVVITQQMTPISEFIVFLGRLFGSKISYETKVFATAGYKF